MENRENQLEEFKKDYLKIQKEYSLPSFEELNKEFWIEDIDSKKTDLLIRKIRSKIGDFIFRVSRFIESLLNPVNTNMFTISIIKSINPDDKKKLSEMMKELIKKEVDYLKLDLEFSLKKEAEFIKDAYEFWRKEKTELYNVLEKTNSKSEDKKENSSKAYFG